MTVNSAPKLVVDAEHLAFHDVICHLTSQQCSVDRSKICSVARLPRSCKIIVQQSKMRNRSIDLNKALGNNNSYVLLCLPTCRRY